MKKAVSITIVLLLLSGIVFGDTLTKTIEVTFNKVNIAVNGQKVDGENILYNGTTYVPLRKVAEILGKDVTWNQATNTAGINDKGLQTAKYTTIIVDGGDLSGNRQSNVKVDIGYGDRVYWAYTNEYGQLVKVTAEKIILQDDKTELVTSDGRYYKDEAKVLGTEREDLDQGHVIADSLGGVSNAYNITPQDSTLNRHGDQAYMEDNIRKAGGCTDFTAIITYPNTTTQIPSHYSYTYTLKGNVIHDEFDNVNPDIVNKNIILSTPTTNIKYSYIGNKDSMKLHKYTCQYAEKTLEIKREYFNNKDEAINKGYEACKVCNP